MGGWMRRNGLVGGGCMLKWQLRTKATLTPQILDGFGRMWDCWYEGNDSFPVICNSSQEDEF